MNTSGRWFREDSYPSKPLKLMSVSAGEFVGALTYALSELSPGSGDPHVRRTGPRWLESGVDSFLKDRALAAGSVISYDTKRNSLVESAKYVGKQPLSEMETWTGFSGIQGDAYDYSAMAVELLASLAGESSLIEYYDNLKIGTTWQKEFQNTFGMSVDEFYDLFEEHRAAGFPDPNRPTPTGPQTVDDYIVWKVGDEVSATAEAEARETVLAVHDYAVGIGMPRIDHPITIFLYYNLDSLAAQFNATTGRVFEDWVGPDFAAGRSMINGQKDFVALNTSAERYQEYSSDTRKESLAESLFNVYRTALTGIWRGTPRDAVPAEGPAWLIEASKRFLTYQALRAPGPESCDLTRARYARIYQSADTPLSDAETWSGYNSMRSAPQHSFLAVELLAEQAGQESIMGYFASLRRGAAWQEAFQTEFGMTVAEFYQLFEERRAAGFPRPRCPTLPPLVTMPGAPEYIKWTIGDEVSAELRQYAVDAARLIHEYATSRGLPDIESEIEIHIHGDLDTLATIYADITGWSFNESRDFWENRGGGVAGAGWVTMPEWTHRNPSEEPIKITRGITHELVHAYQAAKYSLVGSNPYGPDDEAPKHGPHWLLEGSANFFMYKAMDAGGFLSYDSERLKVVDEAKLVAKPLSGLESHTNGLRAVKGGYDLGQLATELLVWIAGEEEAVIRYYTLTQPGTTWQEAFETAFGMPVAEFYELFEEHRAAGFPELDVSK